MGVCSRKRGAGIAFNLPVPAANALSIDWCAFCLYTDLENENFSVVRIIDADKNLLHQKKKKKRSFNTLKILPKEKRRL